MEHVSAWRVWGRYVAAGVGAGAITWVAFAADRPVPIFDWLDLGVHELGHMLMFSGPRMLHFLAGSFLQVAFPLGLAIYFHLRQRDAAGAGFCLAWAGSSAWDVSVYIADAPIQALPLIGGGQHDWAYLLGPQGFDAMDRAPQIAGFVETIGLVMAGVGILIALSPALRRALEVVRGPVPSRPARVVRKAIETRRTDVGSSRDRGVAPQAEGAPADLPLRPDPSGDPWLAAARTPFSGDGEDPL